MRLITALVLAFALALPALAADDLTAAVTAMARIGSALSPSFSPDGRHIAYIANLSGTPQAWIVPTAGGYPRQVTAFDDPVTGITWSPKGDWIALQVAPGGGLNSQIYLVRPDGTGLRRLTAGGKDNNWLGDWSEDGSLFTIASSRRDPNAMDAYLVDAASGKLTLVSENPGIGYFFDVADDNRFAILYRMRSRGDNDLYFVDLASRKETRLTPHEPPASFGSAAFSPDGRTVYLTSNDKRDLVAFGRVRLDASGNPGPIEILAERAGAELDGFEINRQGTLAVLLWNVGGLGEFEFYDLRTNKRSPGPKLPAELAGGLEFSQDGNLLAFSVFGSTTPYNIWVYDLKQKKMWQVTFSPHPGVNLADLVRPQLVTFPAHDGLQLSGWLYLPKNFQKPGPVVLSFHGGPESQDRPVFRSDDQALLLAGIALFAPNVRGSSGFGKKFINLDNGALRVNGVKDIESCVNYLVSSGVGDRKRLGITGGSYGGYMTMAGLTEFPDLFAAGANLFGVVNFETFFKHTEGWMAAISTKEYGDPATEVDLLKRLSPIHKLDKIKAATMVLHGANDTNVPLIEAEQIVANLKSRGVPVEYVVFPDEGHGWRKVPNRIKSTVEITKFFSRHLKQ